MDERTTTKIRVKAEGRPDIWLVQDKDSLKNFITEKGTKDIHNFIGGGTMVVGADHSVESVLQDIDNGERIAVFTDSNANIGHSMAIADKRLEMYDLGPITKEDLEIIE